MSPQAQLLFTGAIELFIALTLGWCGYRVWKRHSQNRRQPTATNAETESGKHGHAHLLNDLARLIGEHTQSVESFQRSLASTDQQSSRKCPGNAAISTGVQLMRDANRRFGSTAESKSTELCQAADESPAIFQNVSSTFFDHRQRTHRFDKVLGECPAGVTASQIQELTFDSMQDVLATKQQLEFELASAKKQIEQQAARLRAAERDARIDALTHIPNRRAYDEHVGAVHSLFERQRIAYSLVILDLDNFKMVNDAYGHAAGDSVLQVTAKLLQSQLRLSDRVFRFGGEEFVMVLVATNLQQAMLVAERARKRIEASIVYFEGRELRITTSAGVCDVRDGLATTEVLELADAALYLAKTTGRNRIEASKHRDEACVASH